MTITQFKKELEELKKQIKPNGTDDPILHVKRIKYLLLTSSGNYENDPSFKKIFEGLTDEEKAIITIDTQPEYIGYKNAMNEGNVTKANDIMENTSKRLADVIKNEYNECQKFEDYLVKMSRDPDYCETWGDFNES